MEFNNLPQSGLYRKVLLSYYTVINITATVGSGDMFPMTDLERLCFVFLINLGDAVFAVAFGLIAGITMQASSNRGTDEFFKKMHSIKELLKQNNGEKSQKAKVEQFFAYSWHLYKSTDMVSIKSLSSKLPYRLSKEVVYYSTKHLLEPMFKQFGSENLIKDVSRVLEQSIYLPGDFIIIKDDIGEEMYFIAEGTVYILAADKRTVLNTLNRGSYFGEMAIFLGLNKRTAYVQAETFCSILTLKKSDLDNIKANYPTVAQDIKKEARKRAHETKAIERINVHESTNLFNFNRYRPNLDQYKTPPGFRDQYFEEGVDTKSRRSSFESQVKSLIDMTPVSHPHQVIKQHSVQLIKSKFNISKRKSCFQLLPKHILEPIHEENEAKPKNKNIEIGDSTMKNKNEESKQGLIQDSFVTDKSYLGTHKINEEEEDGFFRKKYDDIESPLEPLQKIKKMLSDPHEPLESKFTMNPKKHESMKFLAAPSYVGQSEGHHLLNEANLGFIHPSPADDSKKPENALAKYRRKGLKSKRRLSRMNLGKQLALSETSELRMQWIVDIKDV